MLFNRAGPGFELSLSYVVAGVLTTAAFFVFVVGAGLRAQLQPAQTGREAMLGQTVTALSRIDAAGGKVFIEGELWNAVSEAAVEKDQPVEVIGVEGLTLKVKPAEVEPLKRGSLKRGDVSAA
jgi:membrane-bound serine protease (ClpP class)